MSEIKYDRQSRIPNWDQSKLKNATVAVIGAGALGNHVCLGLIGLGIGTIKIYDYDDIEAHNLNRQSLFCEQDIHQNKAETLAKRLQERNSSIMVVGINEKIDDDIVEDLLYNADVVIDCVDLIYVRRILNRYCLENDIPLIHGGISWMGGQTGILTRKTPCINCIYPEDLQKNELDMETSCIRKPEASVVYISQIIAGFMVENVRKVLLPLNIDHSEPSFLMKLDFRLDSPIYYEKINRKSECECVEILQDVAPQILEDEKSQVKEKQTKDQQDLAEFLDEKNGR